MCSKIAVAVLLCPGVGVILQSMTKPHVQCYTRLQGCHSVVLNLRACRHIVVSQTTSLKDAVAVVKRELPEIQVVERGLELPYAIMRLLPKLVQPLTGHDLGVLRQVDASVLPAHILPAYVCDTTCGMFTHNLRQ
jgi:hypothetical protein